MTKKLCKKIKNNKACPAKLQRNRGFVILFAVTLSAILLSIALGVANIAFREIKFGTSAKDSNDAFLAADIGIECAAINDKSTSTVFRSPFALSMPCLGGSVSLTPTGSPPTFWSFTLSGLGSGGQGCTKVTVDKRSSVEPTTTIISKGYNNGGGTCTSGPNTVERETDLSY